MTKSKTAQLPSSELLDGVKLYQQRARITLPYLVQQAKAGRPIYYSDLARQIEIPNARNLNYVLGSIGNALNELARKLKEDIPPIQCVVVNKRNNLPGEGIGGFLTSNFRELNRTQKQKIVDLQLSRVYSYSGWDKVLDELGLAPIDVDINQYIAKARTLRGAGGESQQHKNFKTYIANNPQIFNIRNSVTDTKTEYALPSADCIDVVFKTKRLMIGVEVKSIISDTSDLLRGLFQCVKYKHLIEAEQIIGNTTPNARVILAVEGAFPKELVVIKNLLGVEVIDNIKSLYA